MFVRKEEALRMFKSFVLKRMHLLLAVIVVIALVAVVVLVQTEKPRTAGAEPVQERAFHMVTGEVKATLANGKTLESYQWLPGTIVVQKGEPVKLSIYGVNGVRHPFYIEGLGISGEVMQGKETVVTFTPTKEGTYRLICTTHSDIANGGPMIAYIEVD